MGSKERFTEGRVGGYACPPGKGQAIFHDDDVPGLGVRVTAAGSKAYIFEGKLHKKNVRLTIGTCGAKGWPLGKARERARELRVMLDKGLDPREVEREQAEGAQARQAEALRQVTTLGDLWAAYVDAPHPRWGTRTRALHARIVDRGGQPCKRGPGKLQPGTLYPLVGVRLLDLDGERVSAWLASTPSPAAATVGYRLLRAALRWGMDRQDFAGLVNPSAWSSRSVRDAVPRGKPKQGDALQREQLQQWFTGVQSIANPVVAAYLQALLLTGARREELARLRWDDVDFRWNTLDIPDKVDGRRTVPLTPYVSELLAGLPRRNEWVFSSPRAKSGRLTEPTDAHGRALEVAGLPHLTLHGLRRSFGTLAEWVEIPVGVVAQIQGHKPSALAEKHYRRRPIDMLRMWHSKLEAWILEHAGVQFEAPALEPRLRAVR